MTVIYSLCVFRSFSDLEQVLRSSSGGVSLLSSCPDPGPLHHGQKSTKGLHMTFSCNPSYILSGSASRVCQGNGEWSGHLPTCLRKQQAVVVKSVALRPFHLLIL